MNNHVSVEDVSEVDLEAIENRATLLPPDRGTSAT